MHEIIKGGRDNGSYSDQRYGKPGLRQRHRDRKARLCEQLPDSPGLRKGCHRIRQRRSLAENLRQRAHKDAKILADAQALAETIANLPLTLALKAEEGKLFGTVTATDLAEALAAKGIELDRKLIAVEGIKTVGEYEATAKLHKEVKAVIKFSVTAAE